MQHTANGRKVRFNRSISWLTTRIRTKGNRVKRSQERSITIPATCPEKPRRPTKRVSLINPTPKRHTSVASNKTRIKSPAIAEKAISPTRSARRGQVVRPKLDHRQMTHNIRFHKRKKLAIWMRGSHLSET